MTKKSSQFGKLAPQYNFFLNPYNDERFTRCPQCEAKMGQKKVPLVIHVDPHYPVSLNYTCRYCAHCDLLIAHQDEIERLLAAMFSKHAPEAVGNKYLILGTFDHAYWKEGTKKPHSVQDLPANLHAFKQVLKFEPQYTWAKDEPTPAPKPIGPQVKKKPSLLSEQMQPVDDVNQALALVEKMKSALPLTARPTKTLIRALRQQGITVSSGQALTIKDVLYVGDEGGISCAIAPPGKPKEVLICSLTHLEIEGSNPLAKAMRSYQQKRSAKLARQQRTPSSFTIRARSKPRD